MATHQPAMQVDIEEAVREILAVKAARMYSLTASALSLALHSCIRLEGTRWFQLHQSHQSSASESTLVPKVNLALDQSKSINTSNNAYVRCEQAF